MTILEVIIKVALFLLAIFLIIVSIGMYIDFSSMRKYIKKTKSLAISLNTFLSVVDEDSMVIDCSCPDEVSWEIKTDNMFYITIVYNDYEFRPFNPWYSRKILVESHDYYLNMIDSFKLRQMIKKRKEQKFKQESLERRLAAAQALGKIISDELLTEEENRGILMKDLNGIEYLLKPRESEKENNN